MTTWDMEQQKAMVQMSRRFEEIRKAKKEPEWVSALGAFFLFSPIFGLMIFNLLG